MMYVIYITIYIYVKLGIHITQLVEINMHTKFGRNPSNVVEVMQENVKKKLGKFGINLDYYPPPTFRPPNPRRVNRFLAKS